MRPFVLGAVTSAVVTPVMGDLLGYPFEVAPMVMAEIACLIVRVYLGIRTKSREGWMADLTITALTLLFTAGMVITARPTPIFALFMGTGLGAIGAGLIRYAERKTRPFLGDQDDPPQDHEEGILRASERLGAPPAPSSPESWPTDLANGIAKRGDPAP